MIGHMPTIAGSHVPPPKSWDEFEDISLSAAKLRWQGAHFFRNGRAGQKQDGVDIFGQVNKATIGIQCKNTIGGISENTVLAEIRNAESFSPPLSALYIATTSSRDSLLQEKVRILSLDRAATGKFSVDLLFWNDVVFDLAKDEEEFFKHYPQFRHIQPAAPMQSANGQPTFSADDMGIERHPALGGKNYPENCTCTCWRMGHICRCHCPSVHAAAFVFWETFKLDSCSDVALRAGYDFPRHFFCAQDT